MFVNIGLGQDSTAIAVLYVQGKLPAKYYECKPYFVFSDTGCEMPETYEWAHKHFIPWLKSHDIELYILSPHGPYHQTKTGRSYPDIWTAFMTLGKHPSFPTRTSPRCTANSKGYPLARFRDAKRIEWCGRNAYQQALSGHKDMVVIGIAADEQHRAIESPAKNYECHYPLIELGLTREDCVKIIKDAGLELCMKSGCWLCPHAPAWHFYWLKEKHPELFAKAEIMENACIADRVSRGLKPNYILQDAGMPLATAAEAWHLANPTVTVEEIERWMYERNVYSVYHKQRKRAEALANQHTFDFESLGCPYANAGDELVEPEPLDAEEEVIQSA